ncbi:hypothetical protein HN51_060310 [Arachis hypogaea]|uniref:DUF1262 family protein n=1 Tax=Arachis hypogaea TaxID=3818 RepID=A0A444X971_ARAHY|nr:uncharacterized protein LOC107624383 [Arachis ipaensis]XP_025684435.1 uncharacterized protein LOC112785203 [Arachis hypogaea]QHN83923.1 uncharacterized protein DS421_20g708970 [Arachis hypogaea]RYQ86245.1 hypothetical protein Ahy_B10g105929 [Arachis hypogaea]
MYVTRPLSMYRRSPSTLEVATPDAPYSGYLVITDEEAEAEDACCWRLCRRKNVKRLPFPQDKIFRVSHSSEYQQTSDTKVWFVPVPNHPLSSNRYYIIRARGRYKGKACKCSREGDIIRCCFSDLLNDQKPKPFNLKDLYQIFKIHNHHTGGFFAKSITPDGIPPTFLRKKGWRLRISGSYRSCRLSEALGVDAPLREQLPDFNFTVSRKRSPPVIVGKWYCPFIFVREGKRVKKQMNKSLFYVMTLEQKWEEIYSCGSDEISEEGNVVIVNAYVEREVALVSGMEATKHSRSDCNSMFWFRAVNPYNRRRVSVGLSSAIIENMRWVQEAGGWVNGNGRERVVRVREEVKSESDEWQRFACYVLVESFCLRTLEGRLVIRYDFRHTHKIKYKWE